ncbi:MAG: amidohydrolase family protein, partial [Nocardioidaceae bacterium]
MAGSPVSLVDAHHHVWDLAVREQAWLSGDAMAPIRRSFSAEDLRDAIADADVAATVVVQTVPVPEETPELLDLAGKDDLVAGVVGWVDLTAGSVADDLAALQESAGGQRLVGIRHLVQDEPADWLLRSDVRRGLDAVGSAGLRYDLLTLPHQLSAATETVDALEDVEFVLDHCSKPPIADGEIDSWAADVRALARRPNVACKLSGLVTEAAPGNVDAPALAPYVDAVLDAFGPDRLMFGSDWPVCLLATSYSGWLTTVHELIGHLSDAERAAVLG